MRPSLLGPFPELPLNRLCVCPATPRPCCRTATATGARLHYRFFSTYFSTFSPPNHPANPPLTGPSEVFDHGCSACRYTHKSWVPQAGQFHMEIVAQPPGGAGLWVTQYADQVVVVLLLTLLRYVIGGVESLLDTMGMVRPRPACCPSYHLSRTCTCALVVGAVVKDI